MEEIVGKNIRFLRKAHGWSMDDLANHLARATGHIYTANAIGSWQRGERQPSHAVMLALCTVFGCTIYELYYPNDTDDALTRAQVLGYVSRLGYRHMETLFYLASQWTGKSDPLIEVDRCYALLPPHLRARAIDGFLKIFYEAQQDGLVSTDLDTDLDKLREGLEWLKNKTP